jgi:hypothetical protein
MSIGTAAGAFCTACRSTAVPSRSVCRRILGYRTTPYLLLVTALTTVTCTFVEPVRTTLFHGQINLVLMLWVLWDFSRPERSILRGVGIGLGAAIKLTPAFFVVLLLALRHPARPESAGPDIGRDGPAGTGTVGSVVAERVTACCSVPFTHRQEYPGKYTPPCTSRNPHRPESDRHERSPAE